MRIVRYLLVFCLLFVVLCSVDARAANVVCSGDVRFVGWRLLDIDVSGDFVLNSKYRKDAYRGSLENVIYSYCVDQGMPVESDSIDPVAFISDFPDSDDLAYFARYLYSCDVWNRKAYGFRYVTPDVRMDDGLASDVVPGYYLFVSDAGDGAVLCTVRHNDVELVVKHSDPTLDKAIVDQQNVVDGQDVSFRLNSALCGNLDQYSDYTYVIHDEMTQGLSFVRDSVEVLLSNGKVSRDITESCDISFSGESFVDESMSVSIGELKSLIVDQSFDWGYERQPFADSGGHGYSDQNSCFFTDGVYRFCLQDDVSKICANQMADCTLTVSCRDLRASLYSGEYEAKCIDKDLLVYARIPDGLRACVVSIYGYGTTYDVSDACYYPSDNLIVWRIPNLGIDRSSGSASGRDYAVLHFGVYADGLSAGDSIAPFEFRAMYADLSYGSPFLVDDSVDVLLNHEPDFTSWDYKYYGCVNTYLTGPDTVVLDDWNHFVVTYDVSAPSESGLSYEKFRPTVNVYGADGTVDVRSSFNAVLSVNSVVWPDVDIKSGHVSITREFDVFLRDGDMVVIDPLSYLFDRSNRRCLPEYGDRQPWFVVGDGTASNVLMDFSVPVRPSYSGWSDGFFVELNYDAHFRFDIDAGVFQSDNLARLEYSNNPRDLSSVVFTPWSKETIGSNSMIVRKIDQHGVPVADAGFTLYKWTGFPIRYDIWDGSFEILSDYVDGRESFDTSLVYDILVDYDEGSVHAYVPVRDMVTDDTGSMVLSLENGYYILRENVQPVGYVGASITYFEVSDDGVCGAMRSACAQDYFNEELYRLDNGLDVIPDGKTVTHDVLGTSVFWDYGDTSHYSYAFCSADYGEKYADGLRFNEQSGVYELLLMNEKVSGVRLPETGGHGLVPIMVFGSLVLLLGVVVLAKRRDRS